MLTSVCHSGRCRSGLSAGRLWAFEPPDVRGRRSFGMLRLLGYSRRFGDGCFLPAVLGCHHAFRNIFVTCSQGTQVPDCRRFSIKGNFSVTAFSPEKISETPKDNLATFSPPPLAPPVSSQELLAEVPFHYWYSYADLPVNSSRRRKTRQKKSEQPKSSLTTESTDNSDSLQPEGPNEMPVISSAQAGEPRRSLMREPRETSDFAVPQAEEPKRSPMREIRKQSSLANQKSEESRRPLMRGSRVIAGSTMLYLYPGEGRSSLMSEPRVPSGLSSPRRGKGIAVIDSAFKSGAGRTREECSEIAEMQDMTGIVDEDKVARFDPCENIEEGNDSVRDSSGQLQEVYKGRTSVGTAEGTDMEKEAFRLSTKEINLLVDMCNRSHRQINMGWRGWGHNYIMLVHSYWKNSEVCKIKCKGAVTLDMDFLCNKLEEKTGGRVIHRIRGVVYLYRGRYYDHKFARKLPVMHQRKKTPAKRLPIPFGLTKDDVNAMRARGKELPALCKLAKNGVYVTLLDDIRKAFEKGDLVRVNCQGFEARNFRALGVKLKKLVPCVLISYEFEHILMWRWDGYKTPSPVEAAALAEESFKEDEEDVDQ